MPLQKEHNVSRRHPIKCCFHIRCICPPLCTGEDFLIIFISYIFCLSYIFSNMHIKNQDTQNPILALI